MIRRILESQLRHALTFIGGYLAARGYVFEVDQDLVAGLAAAIAAALLGIFDKLRNNKSEPQQPRGLN